MAIAGQAVTVLAVAIAVVLLLWASLLYLSLRWRPFGLYLMVFKLYAVVLALFRRPTSPGMVADAKRAVAWARAQAADLGARTVRAGVRP